MQSNNSDIRTIYNNSNINIQYDLMHETNNEISHILAYFNIFSHSVYTPEWTTM